MTPPEGTTCPKSGMKGTGTARYGRGTLESEMRMTGEMHGRKLDMTHEDLGQAPRRLQTRVKRRYNSRPRSGV